MTAAAVLAGPSDAEERLPGRQAWVEGLKYGAAGGIAGAFAKSCTAPLARLTILYQVQGFSASGAPAARTAAGQGPSMPPPPPPKLRHAFVQVVRREGVAALWKGNLATILHRLPYSSINFYTYEHANKLLAPRLPPHSDFARTLASGALAGLTACTAAYPLDLVRTRLAAQTHGQYYHGILPTLQRIVAEEGAVGLYRGLGATLLQVVPSLALNFSLYDSIRNSCMALYCRTQATQQQQQLLLQQQLLHQQQQQMQMQMQSAAGPSGSSSEANGGGRGGGRWWAGRAAPPRGGQENVAHTLAVASTVDQGISHSQMLLWHLGDEAGATGGDPQRAGAAAAAAATAEDADGAAARRSSGTAASTSSGGGAAAANVPTGISLASGCISGFLTATVTYPLDVTRRRMQVCGQQHHGAPVSYGAIIRQVMGQGRGLAGFYVGILPEYCKVVPGVAIAFCTYEQLKRWLAVER